jgi:hypothetical protein
MESDRPNTLLNQQLNQYLCKMQTEVGCSGRTLHQVSADYLSLKSTYEKLSQDLEDLDIIDADLITSAQMNEHRELISGLQKLQAHVLQGSFTLKDHPWKEFAHPDHQADEFELLLRTLRFVSIQLSKFWVEIQSFPLFLNVLSNSSVDEIERILLWLQSGPPWSTLVQQPRLIPYLTHGASRKTLLDFARDVKSINALQKEVGSKLNPSLFSSKNIEKSMTLLSESIFLTKAHQLKESILADLETRIQETDDKIGRVQRVQFFFVQIHKQVGLPIPKGRDEMNHLFLASQMIQKIPEAILAWRQPRILAAGQMVRIKAWQDRAKPILELRKRLEAHFQLESQEVNPDMLRDLSAQLASGGMFRSLKAPYREAMEMYQKLLQPELNASKKPKETSLQMIERLTEWASYLEQVQAFDSNAEAKATFGTLFRGIDTEFNLAGDANAWSSQLRGELGLEGDVFGDAVIDFIFKAPPSQLNQVVDYFECPDAKEIEVLLNGEDFNSDVEVQHLIQAGEEELKSLQVLRNNIQLLGLRRDVPFKVLNELETIAEEISFLMKRMESCIDVKACLKTDYQGAETDLTIIEQGIFYIQFIENSDIPDALKAVLLTAYGPQRYGENRVLVPSALASLHAVKDHLKRLDAATRGSSQSIAKGSIPEILSRIQLACRQPILLESWVGYLKCDRNARLAGLSAILDYFEKRSIPSTHYLIAYDLAINACLLKKALGQSTTQALEQALVH